MAIIERKFKWLLEGLQKDPLVLPSASTQAEAQEAGEALLWTRVFMARHHDRLGQTGESSVTTFPSCNESPAQRSQA